MGEVGEMIREAEIDMFASVWWRLEGVWNSNIIVAVE